MLDKHIDNGRNKQFISDADQESIKILTQMYKQIDALPEPDDKIAFAIQENYMMLKSRGLPAYQWVTEAINTLARKVKTKRGLGYFSSMIRNWRVDGLHHLPNHTDKEILSFFAEQIETDILTSESRKIILGLMGTYGAVKITRSIAELQVDYSTLVARHLQEMVTAKYQEPAYAETPEMRWVEGTDDTVFISNASRTVTEAPPVAPQPAMPAQLSTSNDDLLSKSDENKEKLLTIINQNQTERQGTFPLGGVVRIRTNARVNTQPSASPVKTETPNVTVLHTKPSDEPINEVDVFIEIVKSNKQGVKAAVIKQLAGDKISWGVNTYTKIRTLMKHCGNKVVKTPTGEYMYKA